MALPLIPLGIGLLGGYVIVKNKEKILSALHGHKAPTFPAKGAPISAPTQAWLAQQTPEDQALFSQMMASGQFQVGQYMDPSMFGYGAGYPDPSQYGYYDPSQMGYGGYPPDPSQYGGYPSGYPGGYYDPSQGYYDPSQDPSQQQQPQGCPQGQRMNPATGQCSPMPTGGRAQQSGRGGGAQQQKHIVSSKCVQQTPQGICHKTMHSWSDGSVTYT